MKEESSITGVLSKCTGSHAAEGIEPYGVEQQTEKNGDEDSSHRPPPRDAVVESPSMARAKYSGPDTGEPRRGAEEHPRMKMPMSPPATEDAGEMPSAFPASPFLVSGYPSNEVTTAEGVPGVLIMTAVTDPP